MKYLAFVLALAGCPSPPEVPKEPLCEPEAYGPALQACTELAHTLTESIACENAIRERCGRPLRTGAP